MKLKYTEMLQDSRCAHVPFTISSSSDPHIILPESNLSALVDSSELKAVAMWKHCLDSLTKICSIFGPISRQVLSHFKEL